MDYEEFVTKVKGTKLSCWYTGFFDVVVRSRKDRLQYIISSYCGDREPKTCKADIPSITLTLKEPKQLTIFEAGMLALVYLQNKRPMDYAGWHDCIAGKEFIDNIESVKLGGSQAQILKQIQYHQQQIMKLLEKARA